MNHAVLIFKSMKNMAAHKSLIPTILWRKNKDGGCSSKASAYYQIDIAKEIRTSKEVRKYFILKMQSQAPSHGYQQES